MKNIVIALAMVIGAALLTCCATIDRPQKLRIWTPPDKIQYLDTARSAKEHGDYTTAALNYARALDANPSLRDDPEVKADLSRVATELGVLKPCR
jgi:hypothetical protein